MKRIFAIFILVVLFALACRKPDQYPDVPELTFKSVDFSQENIGLSFTLTATFTDGDGDIGYYTDKGNGAIFDSSSSPYYSNFVIKLFRFKNGEWTDTIHFHYLGDPIERDTTFSFTTRIPYLTPEGKNKGLKGDIYKTDNLPLGLNDTIRFEAFIYDRALHKSNVITTPAYFIQN